LSHNFKINIDVDQLNILYIVYGTNLVIIVIRVDVN